MPILKNDQMAEVQIMDVMNELRHTRLSDRIDKSIFFLHSYTAWLWFILVILVCFTVMLRYVFNSSFIWLEELQWHIYGAGFMLALSDAYVRDAHIRVDIFFVGFKSKPRAIIDMLGILLLLWPFLGAVLWFTWPFVVESFISNEISTNPGGLTHRWFIKGFILVGFSLLFMASTARLSRCFATLFNARG